MYLSWPGVILGLAMSRYIFPSLGQLPTSVFRRTVREAAPAVGAFIPEPDPVVDVANVKHRASPSVT